MRCRKVRGLIAASVYGDLDSDERLILEGHLTSCPACRIEAGQLERLAAGIPVREAALDRDLVPLIRRRIAERPVRTPLFGWQYAFAGAACLVFVVLTAFGVGAYRGRPQGPVGPVAESQVLSPLEQAMGRADRLTSDHDFVGAYRVLKQALADSPDDAQAGVAQLRRADLAFAHLHWYPEAYQDYEALADRHPATFRGSVESITRRDLLAEAREHDFASLYALDHARRGTEDQFARLERVVGRYPGTFVASAAAEDMAGLAAQQADPATVNTHLMAMESARDRCTDAMAKRHLGLEVARLYWREMNNPGRACELYHEVLATSGDTTLAQLARRSLADLDCGL